MIKLLAVWMTLVPGSLLAQSVRTDGAVLRDNPTYSSAVVKHQSPGARYSVLESDMISARSDLEAFLLLPRVAQAALEAGLNDKAAEYANKALQLVETFRLPAVVSNDGVPMSNVGEVVFTSNLVLGRLAILSGDTEAAKKYLLLAGHTPGSPVLSGFGPNMSLARELLLASEQETVLQFLDECRVFWKRDKGRLDKWSLEIRSGRTPDFGANLIY